MNMNVYTAINKVQADLANIGISKDRKNAQQGYQFRGIDDIYNTVSPLLAQHKLCILPRVLSRSCEERTSAKGGVLFYVTIEAEFDFVAACDGSKHVVKTFGEAMDSGDKATNKAMSAAYKYALMQAFAIPTEGDNDADATTHEVAKRAIPESVVADFLLAISEAETLEVLQREYNAAYKAARDLNDTKAIEHFTVTKDKRKQALQLEMGDQP